MLNISFIPPTSHSFPCLHRLDSTFSEKHTRKELTIPRPRFCTLTPLVGPASLSTVNCASISRTFLLSPRNWIRNNLILVRVGKSGSLLLEDPLHFPTQSTTQLNNEIFSTAHTPVRRTAHHAITNNAYAHYARPRHQVFPALTSRFSRFP